MGAILSLNSFSRSSDREDSTEEPERALEVRLGVHAFEHLPYFFRRLQAIAFVGQIEMFLAASRQSRG
jgi:hypothetical protein